MATTEPPSDPAAAPPETRSERARRYFFVFLRAVREGDEQAVMQAVMDLSATRRLFAPLAFAVGGLAMLFNGLKLLVTNWRLTLVQALPAMWIWAAMIDLKAHALHGDAFHPVFGPWLIPFVLLIVALTAASFFLNAVFAFAIVQPEGPAVRPAMLTARSRLKPILTWGIGVGIALAFAAAITPRWGHPWFGLSLSVVVGVMMVAYVSVPARLIGGRPERSRRDKLAASAVGGALGAVVCTPPYVLGRIGLLMLGSKWLLVPGVILLIVGLMLQAGATGAVKAVKMSAVLVQPDALAADTSLSPPVTTP